MFKFNTNLHDHIKIKHDLAVRAIYSRATAVSVLHLIQKVTRYQRQRLFLRLQLQQCFPLTSVHALFLLMLYLRINKNISQSHITRVHRLSSGWPHTVEAIQRTFLPEIGEVEARVTLNLGTYSYWDGLFMFLQSASSPNWFAVNCSSIWRYPQFVQSMWSKDQIFFKNASQSWFFFISFMADFNEHWKQHLITDCVNKPIIRPFVECCRLFLTLDSSIGWCHWPVGGSVV